MRNWRRAGIIFALAALPVGAAASPISIRGGQWVEIPTDLQRLPAAADEFELLLRVGQTGTPPIRLTRSQSLAEFGLAWRAPNLPLRGVRLQVRVGVAGIEIELPPGEPFDVVPDARLELDLVALRAQELWTETWSLARDRTRSIDGRSRLESDLPNRVGLLTADPDGLPDPLSRSRRWNAVDPAPPNLSLDRFATAESPDSDNRPRYLPLRI